MEEKKMSDCEVMVMSILWKESESKLDSESKSDLVLSQICEKLEQTFHKHWAETTVSTYLTRLIEKGYLRNYKSGRRYCYCPLVSKKTYLTNVLTFLNSLGIDKEMITELLREDL